MNLTGVWEGHYFHNWITGELVPIDESSRWAFPIRLMVTQDGDNLFGSMTDLSSYHEITFREQLELSKKSMTWIQKQNARRVLDSNPDLLIRVELPADSSIEGHVDGREVVFTKTYHGRTSTIWIGRTSETIYKVDSPPVNYFGTLSDEEDLIIGRFDVSMGRDSSKGRFQLRRSQQ